MKNRDLHALYGLKWNPFAKDVPVQALKMPPQAERFFWQVEHLAFDGGFAMLSGAPGSGKSSAMRMLEERISQVGGIVIARVDRPQSNVRDFYLEVGEAFGISLKSGNRYGGFKRLREEWLKQISAASFRPFLLIDEAQVMPIEVLSEIRFLSSHKFDSNSILAIVLAGDQRLPLKLRESEELQPLDSRIRARLILEKQTCDELIDLLDHATASAGSPALLTPGVKSILAEYANGNPRTLMQQAEVLLKYAAEKEARCIDEQILFDFDGAKFKPRGKPPRQNSRNG